VIDTKKNLIDGFYSNFTACHCRLKFPCYTISLRYYEKLNCLNSPDRGGILEVQRRDIAKSRREHDYKTTASATNKKNKHKKTPALQLMFSYYN
jgi:hypothetical protein